ncbi:MAG: hypothetical protein A2499_07915 [Stygiobacter sp. RIFOXYC12_FULL_38_8]|nr:MAG: hypothetical protein A2X62_10235 [Stygiobacter sp. GWC2_38_9]OGV09515.1 MAG: hypothetical protein A2299_13310 [Stygiobacter sp. RIFOXYB2_FULL_37_11]OGV10074.1 MAG: hypothetical protein A2237_09875 [Stygiobacter sp. RIFOXYA2_FULL_38_8]OGV16650.1 MAG: hypothetical protein A2440_02935 [Stygiobacter sp. RIFOXYC2_FULL_38_25]OGV22609.1 MAG: hypothetical protein A2499_07915 [Stygiobacter sp. RIFOXYC12_FULL_38_8]OGV81195.1 MAG: hypothetical protein A2X65_10530 [Stygiobacter sp. GWF2_38_21]RJQ
MKNKNFFLILLTISALSVLTSCGSSAVVQNTWRSTEIKIDGNFTDWQNHLKMLPDQKISLGFTNDDKFLYMCLVTEDRMKIMQMTRAGFITWFIPSGGSDNTFGIKYPLPNKNLPREQMQNMGREMFQQQGGLDKIVNMLLEKQTEMQILNSDKYSLSLLPIENQDGIKAKLGYVDGKFVYELQVPLAVHTDYAFQIAAMPGENLQIKFETEQAEATAGRGSGAGMAQGGGGQMGGGGMGGMRQGAGGGNMQRFQMPEPLNYSTEVKLAQQK